jgi:uncharacterized protein (DUF433 family)
MGTRSIHISEKAYQRLAQEATRSQRTPDELAEELLEARATEHPYIVRIERLRGGRPVLRGSSMPVWLIAAMWKSGDSADDILRAYPHLQPAAVYDAISYYLDHSDEIETQIAENRIENALAAAGAQLAADGLITFPHG